MRILVTGGAGYIGSHAVKLFLSRGHEVTVFDNLSLGHREAVPADRLIVGDLADNALVNDTIASKEIEAIVHFAASTYVGESVTNPAKYYQNNTINTLNLIESARKNGVKRFVFSSTAATYGVPDTSPIIEDTIQSPINPYGNSKLACEKALLDYVATYDMGCAILRYFNAAGASPDGDIGEDHTPETHLIPLVIQAAMGQRKAISIFGTDYPTPDGTCIRDYIHVMDLAEAHLLALEKMVANQPLKLNLGVGHGYSIREVIDAVREVGGKPIPVEEAERRAGDPPVLVAASDKAKKILGWQPKYDQLHSIIETAWKWHEANPNGYAK